MAKAPTTSELLISASRAGAGDRVLTQLVELHIQEQHRRAAPYRPKPLLIADDLIAGLVAGTVAIVNAFADLFAVAPWSRKTAAKPESDRD